MKLNIFNYKETEDSVSITMRAEQEENGYSNSVIDDFIISKAQYPHIATQDEFKTLAHNLLKPVYERVFKDTGYVEESLNPVDFNIIKPSVSKVSIVGNGIIRKIDGVDPGAMYFGNVYDQYGNYMKNCDVELLEPIEDVSIDDGLLILGDYTGEVKLHCSYYSHEDNVVVTVKNEEKRLSDDEIILNAIADLYERMGAK